MRTSLFGSLFSISSTVRRSFPCCDDASGVGTVVARRIALKGCNVWERKLENSVVWTISMRSRISEAA